MIVVVRPEDAARAWSIIEPMLARVTKETHGCYEPIDVLKEVMAGTQVMWAAFDPERKTIDAVMTTCIASYPRKKHVRVLFVSGSRLSSWRTEFIEALEKYARDMKCAGIEGAFRRGWARVYPGMKETGVSLYKELA